MAISIQSRVDTFNNLRDFLESLEDIDVTMSSDEPFAISAKVSAKPGSSMRDIAMVHDKLVSIGFEEVETGDNYRTVWHYEWSHTNYDD